MHKINCVTNFLIWIDSFFESSIVTHHEHRYRALQRRKNTLLLEEPYQIIYLLIHINHCLNFRHIGKHNNRSASLFDLEDVGKDLGNGFVVENEEDN